MFDEEWNRYGTGSIKYGFQKLRGKPDDVIPLWVADMDFQSPPEVLNALQKYVSYGIFGYTFAQPQYENALVNWFSTRFGWNGDARWLLQIPGVMFGVGAAIQALSDEGEAVLIQQPVYQPFPEAIVSNRRRLVVNTLEIGADGRYYVDFDAFEKIIVQEKVKIFLLCSPHNPVSRIWTPSELRRMGEICLKHGVKIISDEIHADFALFGNRHTIFPSLAPEFAQNCVLCTAPSKTFNLMGLQTANLWIPNPDLRKKVRAVCEALHWFGISAPALAATTAAYEHCGGWFDEVCRYLEENIRFVTQTLSEMRSGIRVTPADGTYLLWLDCRPWGKSAEEVDEFFVQKAKLWLIRGDEFGSSGSGFMRLNVASPRPLLLRAFLQLRAALDASR